jgi:CCR4-NOT transcription complex subunit 4
VGFEGGSGEHNGSGDHEPTVTVDVKLESPGIKGMPKLEGVGIKELEKLVHQARKETEALEKKVEKLIKRNRKIVGLF